MEVRILELEFILLAKSKKYNNYCVAGIDIHSLRWIRLISDDPSISNAVPPYDLMYKNDLEAAVLDKVALRCKRSEPLFYQPENFILDNQHTLFKKGQIDYFQVEKFAEKKDYIFHNTDKKIHSKELNDIQEKEQYSLVLIKPLNPIIHVKTWEDGNKKISCSFDYNKRKYRFFSVTDHNILNHYLEKNDGNYNLQGNLLFVISLGEIYDRDSCHYKLIASVITGPV